MSRRISGQPRARTEPAVDAEAPRERMVRAAAGLISERGLSGASFSEVIERSGAPRGSIYHHFPDGKDSLASDALALVASRMLALLRPREGETPTQVIERFVGAWRTVLERSEFKAGCAVAAVANETLAHPALGAQAGEVFVSWERALETALAAAGMAAPKAASTAALALASMEGALVICRARKELGPLESVRAALLSFVTSASTGPGSQAQRSAPETAPE